MRITLALQGRPGAPATALVASLQWPTGARIRATTVIDPATIDPTSALLPSLPHVEDILDRWTEIERRAASDLDLVVRRLRRAGLDADAAVEVGEPARATVEAARRDGSDLLIVGVTDAAEEDSAALERQLVDTAPCPVLVARRASITRLLVCTDGSSAARAAETFVATWPPFAAQRVTVLSIVETHPVAALVPGLAAFNAHALAERRGRHEEFARDAANRLGSRGREAMARLAEGPIGSQVSAAVEASRADVVVLGADDRRGWSRMLLGGVAREVLASTDASVLVVRGERTTQSQTGRAHARCRGPTARRTPVAS